MTGLREAARALVDSVVECGPPDPLAVVLDCHLVALRAALDAPPPGQEELRVMLLELADVSFNQGADSDLATDNTERDRRIDKILDTMWEPKPVNVREVQRVPFRFEDETQGDHA